MRQPFPRGVNLRLLLNMFRHLLAHAPPRLPCLS
jgi:hypothetical protein